MKDDPAIWPSHNPFVNIQKNRKNSDLKCLRKQIYGLKKINAKLTWTAESSKPNPPFSDSKRLLPTKRYIRSADTLIGWPADTT